MGWMMKRGDVYWINLDPTMGSEIKKKRLCVIIGATPINKARRTVVVVPLSSSPNAHPPLTIAVRCMKKKVVAVCDQIRSVDKSRFAEKIESMAEHDLKNLDDGLKQVLCL
jgi:mRNA interferase MazF